METEFDETGFIDGLEQAGFTDVKRLDHKGQMKHVYRALQRGKAQRPVVIKVDRKPHTPQTEKLQERGCGIDNEFDIATEIPIESSISNGIIPVISDGFSASMHYTVEPEFSDSRSLTEVISEGKPLSPRDWRSLMDQVTSAISFLRKQGFYHRDLNGGNILVRDGKRGLEARITDLGNATRSDSVELKTDPTAGGRFVRDPLLSEPFTGKPAQYNDGSEVYALAMQGVTAAIGQPPVSYDPEKGVAINCFTGQSILDNDGKLDNEKHTVAIQMALKRLPRKLRRFRGVLEKGLSIDSKDRYVSVEEFRDRFEMANTPSTLERVLHNKPLRWAGGFATALVAATATAAVLFPEVGQPWKGYLDAIKEANKLGVHTEWDFRGPVLTNDLIKPNIYAYVDRAVQKENSRMGCLFYPNETNHLAVEPGETVHVHISCEELPHKKINNGNLGSWLPSFNGRAYIQGIPFETEQRPVYPRDKNNSLETIVKNDFRVQAVSPNFVMDGPGQIDYGDVSITVPLGTPSGNYLLPVEIYQPTKEIMEDNKSGWFDNIVYPNPGGLLSCTYIPVVIGSPSREMAFSFLGSGSYSNRPLYFKPLSDNVPWTMGSSESTNGLVFELRIPEEGIVKEVDISGNQSVSLDWRWFHGNNLSTEPRTLEISARDSDGREVLYQAFPIRRVLDYKAGDKEIYKFDFAYPDKGFSERVLALREERLRERASQIATTNK